MTLTPEFFQNVILLVLTVAFTGLLAPYVLKKVDERKSRELLRLDEVRHREQKLFEAELVRCQDRCHASVEKRLEWSRQTSPPACI